MSRRRVYDREKHVHFVTFSCFKRRQFLSPDRAKRIVIGHLGSRLTAYDGLCLGFVIMPDHVHALIWFPEAGQLSPFMNRWKGESSHALKTLFQSSFPNYWATLNEAEPIWQPKYYGFNIWSRPKVEEKLDYMHMNPVRAGLVELPDKWLFSSARWYLRMRSVGIPIGWPPGLELDDEFNGK